MPEKLTPARRALTASEAEHLRERVRRAYAGRRSSRVVIAAGVFVSLWLLTVYTSDAPFWVATAAWLVIGAVVVGWVYRDLHVRAKSQAQGFESALRRNFAEVFDIKATRFVTFEEVEDEGAAYAFEREDGSQVCITGQEFYEDETFPCLDFTLIHPLDENDVPVSVIVEPHSAKATPVRTVPAAARKAIELPGHLTVLNAPLGVFNP